MAGTGWKRSEVAATSGDSSRLCSIDRGAVKRSITRLDAPKVTPAAITLVVLLTTACGNNSDESPAEQPSDRNQVDSCYLLSVSGTCVEYTLSELDDWDRSYVERACPKHKRGDIVGKYKKDSPCPSQNRIARCADVAEDPTEPYEYDKHYYVNTAEGYSWDPDDVRVTCAKLSGRYLRR